VRQARRQVAVVGEEQQSLRLVVQAADRVDVFADANEQVDHRPAPLRVGPGRHVAGRLVEQDVALALRRAEAAAVHADVVGVPVGFGAHLEHRLAVDRDPALGDQPFGGAARRHAGLREDLLQPLFHLSS